MNNTSDLQTPVSLVILPNRYRELILATMVSRQIRPFDDPALPAFSVRRNGMGGLVFRTANNSECEIYPDEKATCELEDVKVLYEFDGTAARVRALIPFCNSNPITRIVNRTNFRKNRKNLVRNDKSIFVPQGDTYRVIGKHETEITQDGISVIGGAAVIFYKTKDRSQLDQIFFRSFVTPDEAAEFEQEMERFYWKETPGIFDHLKPASKAAAKAPAAKAKTPAKATTKTAKPKTAKSATPPKPKNKGRKITPLHGKITLDDLELRFDAERSPTIEEVTNRVNEKINYRQAQLRYPPFAGLDVQLGMVSDSHPDSASAAV